MTNVINLKNAPAQMEHVKETPQEKDDRHLHAKLSIESCRAMRQSLREQTMAFFDMLEHPKNILQKTMNDGSRRPSKTWNHD
jgi:hypothetical protein